MASREEYEQAAAARFVNSDEGKVLLAWMRRVAKLDDTVMDPNVSDNELRNYTGRQWLVNTLVQLAKKAQ